MYCILLLFTSFGNLQIIVIQSWTSVNSSRWTVFFFIWCRTVGCGLKGFDFLRCCQHMMHASQWTIWRMFLVCGTYIFNCVSFQLFSGLYRVELVKVHVLHVLAEFFSLLELGFRLLIVFYFTTSGSICRIQLLFLFVVMDNVWWNFSYYNCCMVVLGRCFVSLFWQFDTVLIVH